MHVELGSGHRHEGTAARAERRTRWVVAITLAMMALEILGGVAFGSMALLADGWHMGTHAAAIGVAAFAYAYARRHASDPRFASGTGKVGALGAFASAVALAAVAVLVCWESLARIATPRAIRFDEAIVVGAVGLAVNLVCAVLLHEGAGHVRQSHSRSPSDVTPHHHPHSDGPLHHHGHGHEHAHGHAQLHSHGHRDLNLRGAFLHVAADAVTSVAAIVALVAGKLLGWTWLDPVMGVAGALLVARWAHALLVESGRVLLDISPAVHADFARAVEVSAAPRAPSEDVA